jgi:hypothetical protein
LNARQEKECLVRFLSSFLYRGSHLRIQNSIIFSSLFFASTIVQREIEIAY